MVNSLNSFFEREGIQAIAYRLRQSRFATQLADILVDSKIAEYYLAIECKSLDARKTRSLYFKQHFSEAAGGHQIERETDFITRSGRQGILAVELRYGVGKSRTAHLVPWGQIFDRYNEGVELMRYPVWTYSGSPDTMIWQRTISCMRPIFTPRTSAWRSKRCGIDLDAWKSAAGF